MDGATLPLRLRAVKNCPPARRKRLPGPGKTMMVEWTELAKVREVAVCLQAFGAPEHPRPPFPQLGESGIPNRALDRRQRGSSPSGVY